MISVDDYMAAHYRPDRDYVDGVVEQRNLGLKSHSKLQGEVLAWFHDRRREFAIAVFPEQRVRVSDRRFRIPDVCVTHLPEPDEQVFTAPPYICIEVLSPEDTFPRLQDRFDDYLKMGAPNVWVLDPASRRAWRITVEGHLEALDGVLKTSDGKIEMALAELFRD
jgi:Uma2 family endonuclease